ncbi:NAD(P)H:quinone oxidoreductase [Mesobacterium sp. TK19101]|uniref:NAD(P)H:quinone oxidoreductase n=1 Tax=Mesobacterium hydrothermale TaxID=3111907 RepID=A0ABU6HDT4_9RHOB|nr:NAD(P)H:quinone oxidoreductase [Mesobacterium sp. TK19101]MEC3859658.1 NAD(P)H:quinone oxidoreductase [Mesobacterium sp. TK19101]
MTKPKIAIIYYSTYGTNHAVASEAARAAEAAGAEVRLRRVPETAPKDVVAGQEAWQAHLDATANIPEISHDDMAWADGYFFAAPTRFGSMPSQLRAFIDTLGGLWFTGELANKTVTATTSAQNAHGGQESTLLAFYTSLMHWGTIVVTPGYTDAVVSEAGGNPYGFSATNGVFDDKGRAAVAHQARRLVQVTAKLAQQAETAAAA